ncbi:hypothetical protein F5148DRAFT_1251961, partial [Russula earlei]
MLTRIFSSSSSAVAFSLRVFSSAVIVISLDVLVARFARSPIGTASSDMDLFLILRGCWAALVHLPSLTREGVV